MNLKRFTAGVLAAATVFAASASISDNGVSLFADKAITAEAATNYEEVVYGNLRYTLNPNKKVAELSGVNYQPLENLKIHNEVIWHGVTYKVKSIKNNAFKDNGYLKTVDLSCAEELDTIPSGAFQGCKKLAKVSFPPKIKYILSSAFENTPLECAKVGSISNNDNTVTIPNTVTTIGMNAFKDCKKIKNLVFEATSSSSFSNLMVSTHAFMNNTGLRNVTFNRKDFKTARDIFEGSYTYDASTKKNTAFTCDGSAAPDYVRNIYKMLLSEWGLSFNKSASEDAQKKFFNDLQVKLSQYMKRGDYEIQSQEGCAATVISLKMGTCGGFARVFYEMCLQAGVPESNILFAGDNHCHAWNYVKAGDLWYNIDASNNIGLCGCDEFITKMNFDRGVEEHDPHNWIASVKNSISADDQNHVTKKFDAFFESGSEWEISYSGSRVW